MKFSIWFWLFVLIYLHQINPSYRIEIVIKMWAQKYFVQPVNFVCMYTRTLFRNSQNVITNVPLCRLITSQSERSLLIDACTQFIEAFFVVDLGISMCFFNSVTKLQMLNKFVLYLNLTLLSTRVLPIDLSALCTWIWFYANLLKFKSIDSFLPLLQ